MKEMHQHREHMLDVAERIIEKRRRRHMDEETIEFTPIGWASENGTWGRKAHSDEDVRVYVRVSERRRMSNLKASVILVVGSFIVWFGGLGLIVWLLTR